MKAERLILETDDQGLLQGIPRLPPRSKVEAIFLLISDSSAPETNKGRQPPSELAGKVKIKGDIVGPAITEKDWKMLG